MVDVASIASKGADGMMVFLMVIMVIGAILVPLLIILNLKRFKHKVQIRQVTDKGSVIFDDKARDYVEDGVKYWKLLKRKAVISCPPEESLHVTKNGKLYATAYYTENHGYVWANDNVNRQSFDKQREEITLVNGEKKVVLRNVFEPFSTQERALYAAQIRKAAERKGSTIWEKVEKFVPYIMLLIMFVLILLFWEDIAKPVQELSSQNAEISKQNAIISEQNAKVIAQLGYADVKINQNLPPDAQG